MKQVERYFYPAIFIYEPGKEIAVDFPDLGCATSGTTDDDAFLSARELSRVRPERTGRRRRGDPRPYSSLRDQNKRK